MIICTTFRSQKQTRLLIGASRYLGVDGPLCRLILVVLTALAVSACSDSAPSSPTSPSSLASASVPPSAVGGEVGSTAASTAAPSPSAANYEQKFMTDMIDHHQMAVAMGEGCLEQATHAELRQLCESIIATQSAEIRQMQDWLRRWYSVTYSPQMNRGDERELQRLSSLSDADFEIAFMEMMIRHHEAAVEEGQRCIDRAFHRQLINLCQDIVASQSAEIQQMREWLCEWYGRC